MELYFWNLDIKAGGAYLFCQQAGKFVDLPTQISSSFVHIASCHVVLVTCRTDTMIIICVGERER